MTKKEYILCAAIWFNDGKKYAHQPKNIEIGVVFCGRRHHNIFAQLQILVKERQDQLLISEEIQGFITNLDRFVDRVEAAKIAFDAGQTKEKVLKLYSEDLY